MVGELLPKALRRVLTSACALVALTFGVAEQANAQAPGGAQPALVSIDLKGSNNYRCKTNLGGLLPTVEFQIAGQQLPQFVTSAAKLGTTIDADITYKNPSLFLTVSSTTVRAEYNGVTCGPTRTITFSPPLAPLETRTVTTQIGALPNRVDDGTLLVLTASTGIPLKLFLVYDSPRDQMNQPWLGMLQRACAWARGESTPDEIARKVVFGFYYSQEAAYDRTVNNYFIPDTGRYLLKAWLSHSGPRVMDCKDVAGLTSLLLKAVGLQSEPEVWGEFSGDYDNNGNPIFLDFLTKPLCGIGSDSDDPANYNVYTFTHHAMVSLHNGNYADAAAAQQYHFSTFGGYWNPPCDWPFTGYWHIGLVVLPNPSNPKTYPISMLGMPVI